MNHNLRIDRISLPFIFTVVFFLSTNCTKEEIINPYNGKTTAVFNLECSYGTVTDVEGNIYKTVTIGTQTWMAENLRTTMYNDGMPIPNISDDSEWTNLTTGAYCHNSNDPVYIASYGQLYNWHAVGTEKLSPAGWHVPDNQEWAVLTEYLGGNLVAGGHLKETGLLHWNESNLGATNSTGFTGLPGGYRLSTGEYYSAGDFGYWWSSSRSTNVGADGRNLYYCYAYLYYSHYYKTAGFSVRCVKD
jgi:uncharacterized protein (TIGR02145 family)